MSPQRRTALMSVLAAASLVAVKLGAGLGAHSLGLVSEAGHSGTDLVAALLTFFSARGGRRYRSAALQANALHFGSDLVGSIAVLVGLLLARAGHAGADSVAALFVSVLVLIAAARLMRRNVDVLMDVAPLAAEESARAAIARITPTVDLRRLRMRQSGNRQFAD